MNDAPAIIDALAESFPPVTLEEMDSVKLLNRLDTKYVTDASTLAALLEDARAAGYRALETSGSRISPYTTVYYDTAGLKMYLDHHNKRLVRQKVRTRVYENSGDAFLEIRAQLDRARRVFGEFFQPLLRRDAEGRDGGEAHHHNEHQKKGKSFFHVFHSPYFRFP